MVVNLKQIAEIMFSKRNLWYSTLSDDDKRDVFFIFNRYFSKKYPIYSEMLNNHNIDKASAMDMWFEFMKTHEKNYPTWLWRKIENNNKKNVDIIKDDVRIRLKNVYDINDLDIDYLIENDINFLKKKIKMISDIDKQRDG